MIKNNAPIFKKWAYNINSLFCFILGILFRCNYHSERKIVLKGIEKYKNTKDNIYLLRRNIHRIEKALTIRKIKEAFGLEYIYETVSAFSSCLKSNGDSNTLGWSQDVLDKYFQWHKSSNNPVILKSRDLFYSSHKIEISSDNNSKKISTRYNELYDLCKNRISSRVFTETKIEISLIEAAIKTASLSPSACNRQPLHYRIIQNKEMLAQLKSIIMGMQTFKDEVNMLIVLIGDYSAYELERDRHLIYVDGGLSSMLFLLGLESLGISACTIHWPATKDGELKLRSIINLEEYEQCLLFFAVGYQDRSFEKAVSVKKNIKESLKYDNE